MNNIILVILGILSGFLLLFYPASIFFTIVTALVVYLLYQKIDLRERNFILAVFFSALIFRLILIMVTHYLSLKYGLFVIKSYTFPGMEGGAIIGDDIGIHQRAWIITDIARGMELSREQARILFDANDYGWHFHIYILGLFYYLFGIVPLLGKCLNALFGTLSGIIVYFIAKELFGLKVARLACILTVFFPTLLLWSLSNLKDTMFIFFLISLIYCQVLFLKSNKIRYLLLILPLLFLISRYRGFLFLLTFAAVVFSLVISMRLKYKKIFIALMFVLAIIGISRPQYFYGIMKQKMSVKQLITSQKSYVISGGTVYKIYPERFYVKDDLMYIPPITIPEFTIGFFKGLSSFLFKPFPWDMDNKSKLFFLPVSLIWLALFPFFIAGLLASVRYHVKNSVFLILLFILFTIALSLSEGNIGTMIRHRDMLTPIYLIFSSWGLVRFFKNSSLRQ